MIFFYNVKAFCYVIFYKTFNAYFVIKDISEASYNYNAEYFSLGI